jgi:hypothetical protein
MKQPRLLALLVVSECVSCLYALRAREINNAHRCDLPVYDMQTWIKEHGGKVPDHAAVFRADQETTSWGAFNWKDENEFVEKYGDNDVRAFPDYSGQLAFMGVPVRGLFSPRPPMKEVAKIWNNTKAYIQDFGCASNLWKAVKDNFEVPSLFKGDAYQNNLMVGPKHSGLPFHKHQQTWQGLSHGLKAWHIIPAGFMHRELELLTGPGVFPVHTWAHIVEDLPLGRRPLYCVQRPGEIIWFPDGWWHATENLAEFNVAFGGRDEQLQSQSDSLPRKAQLDHFRKYSSGDEALQLYTIMEKPMQAMMNDRSTSNEKTIQAITPMMNHIKLKANEEVLRSTESGDRSFERSAAFTYCVMGEKMKNKYWIETAAQLDYAVYQRQCLPKNINICLASLRPGFVAGR